MESPEATSRLVRRYQPKKSAFAREQLYVVWSRVWDDERVLFCLGEEWIIWQSHVCKSDMAQIILPAGRL
jgi:hypothetical protein